MERITFPLLDYLPAYSNIQNSSLAYQHPFHQSQISFNSQFQTLKQQYDSLLLEHQTLKQKYEQLLEKTITRKKKTRRSGSQLNKCYSCPYDPCKRQYASEYALNLHMKNKHSGGTKKERDRAAKTLIRCERDGKKPPRQRVKLPPNYLQQNLIRLTLMDSEDYALQEELSE